MANDLMNYGDGGDDPYAAYGRAAAPQDGIFLKFNKGAYLAGKDAEEVPVGSELLALMDGVEIGFVKWVGGVRVDARVGLLAEGFQPPKRAELGDLDQSEWELGTDNQPRDPWSFSNALPLQRLDVDADDDEARYVFVTSSKGGLGAIGQLCKEYSEHRRQKPGELPVIALGVGSYQHAIKAYGRISYPVFEVVAWQPRKDEARPALEEVPAPPAAAELPKPPPAAKPALAAAPAARQARAKKKTDEIAF